MANLNWGWFAEGGNQKTVQHKTTMKSKLVICSALMMGLVTGCMTEKHEGHGKEAKLEAEAKVSKAERKNSPWQSARRNDQRGRTGKGKRQIDLVL